MLKMKRKTFILLNNKNDTNKKKMSNFNETSAIFSRCHHRILSEWLSLSVILHKLTECSINNEYAITHIFALRCQTNRKKWKITYQRARMQCKLHKYWFALNCIGSVKRAHTDTDSDNHKLTRRKENHTIFFLCILCVSVSVFIV